MAITTIVFTLIAQNSRAGGLAFDTAGNLYLSERESVLKFAPDGTKSTFATGLKNASGLAFDHKGNLFVSDAGSLSTYRFAPDGTKSTFLTDTSSFGMACDPSDNLYVAQGGTVYKFSPDGAKSKFASGFGSARDVATDATGNVYVLDLSNIMGTKVHKYAPNGKEYSFLTLIEMEKPSGLAVDASGNIYLARSVAGDRSAILKFTPEGQKSTFSESAGTIALGSIAADPAGNAFVFNGISMDHYFLRKFNALGARTISASPDKQWEYRFGLDHFPEIAKAGEKQMAVDLDKDGGGVPHPTEDAIVWAPDSKSFAFNYSPPHAPHTSYDTVAIYQLRGTEWTSVEPLVNLESDLSQLAQLGKNRLPKKISREHAGESDVLKLDHWIDASTAVIHAQSGHSSGKSRSAASYDFTLKFDGHGKWKIVEMRPAKE